MINILSVPLSPLSFDEALDEFFHQIKKGNQFYATTPNAEIILEAQKNQDLMKILQESRFNFADSVSVLWAGECVFSNWSIPRAMIELCFLPIRKNSWKALPDKISGSDIFGKICERAAGEHKIFLIGGLDSARLTRDRLRAEYPNIEVECFDGKLTSKTSQKYTKQIKDFNPDIIFVATGCPHQELWIRDHLDIFPNTQAFMGIGGTFDFYAKVIPRAPMWMQKLGLEWLFRLLKQPSRFRRIWKAVVVFPLKILKY